MRYEIKNGQWVESFFIDAPYDSKMDANSAIVEGVINHTKEMAEPEYFQDNESYREELKNNCDQWRGLNCHCDLCESPFED